MGDSQVAFELSGTPVCDECAVVVLGPGGYGDHSAPPRLAVGGLPLGPLARSEPIYAPLTLPIRAIVSSYRVTSRMRAITPHPPLTPEEQDQMLQWLMEPPAAQVMNTKKR